MFYNKIKFVHPQSTHHKLTLKKYLLVKQREFKALRNDFLGLKKNKKFTACSQICAGSQDERHTQPPGAAPSL